MGAESSSVPPRCHPGTGGPRSAALGRVRYAARWTGQEVTMRFPQSGRPVADVVDELAAKRRRDVRWQDGRAFGLVFDGGSGAHEAAERASLLYLHDNALNTRAFPSLGEIQSEVVGWTADLLHGGADAAGFLTSGGTESILCAVLAARERARAERGVEHGAIVLAESAHAAFHKAAHLFGLRVRKVPVKPDWTADVAAMGRAVDGDTVLLVA